jgi:hypothetical protein
MVAQPGGVMARCGLRHGRCRGALPAAEPGRSPSRPAAGGWPPQPASSRPGRGSGSAAGGADPEAYCTKYGWIYIKQLLYCSHQLAS